MSQKSDFFEREPINPYRTLSPKEEAVLINEMPIPLRAEFAMQIAAFKQMSDQQFLAYLQEQALRTPEQEAADEAAFHAAVEEYEKRNGAGSAYAKTQTLRKQDTP